MTARSQVWALVRLRWALVRSPLVKIGLSAAMALVPLLGALVLLGRGGVEPAALDAAINAAPAAYLGFGLLAIIAPLTAGGSELFPSDQLVAYPVRPGTLYLSSLVLAPVNLVWIVQLLVLTAETGLIAHESPLVWEAGLTSALYVGAGTALGQAFAWLVTGLRRRRSGRLVLRSTLAVVAVSTFLLIRTGHGDDIVHNSFAPWVVDTVRAGAYADTPRWMTANAVLLAVLVAGFFLGVQACGWALRRPADRGAEKTSKEVARRATPDSAYQALLATDRASVWRAPALRRGALVLLIMPGVAAAGVGLPWKSLVFLPGLVAAGGGLLFGFNAFCLDASGAVWLASLPHAPGLLARAKARVTAEAVLLASVMAAVLGSIRAVGAPTPTQVMAIIASALGCSVLVVAMCVSSSVRHPYRADLNGPRDAVAPPGALVLTSVRLVLPAAILGGILEATADIATWWVPVAIALPVAVISSWSISSSLRSYDEPLRRSRIVSTVSAG